MKAIAGLLVVVAGMCAAQAQAATKLNESALATKASAADCWCRTPNGSWVRVSAPNNSPAAAPQALTQRRTSNVGALRARFDIRPDRVGDTDWYLNGRGAFSD